MLLSVFTCLLYGCYSAIVLRQFFHCFRIIQEIRNPRVVSLYKVFAVTIN